MTFYFASLFLLTISTITSVFAFYTLIDDPASLVANPAKDVLYVFQFPRTAQSPSSVYYFSALCMKVEIWLHWNNVKFHRISNMSALGSPKFTLLPFAMRNGELIEGSDAIVERFGGYKPDNEEKNLRREIDDKLFKILMVDRVTRDPSNGNKGGLDWFLDDEALMQQVVPLFHPNRQFPFELADGKYKIHLNPISWAAYFDAYTVDDPSTGEYFRHGKCRPGPNTCVEVKMKFMREFVRREDGSQLQRPSWEDWTRFGAQLHQKIIRYTLAETFIASHDRAVFGDASEPLLLPMLRNNVIYKKPDGFAIGPIWKAFVLYLGAGLLDVQKATFLELVGKGKTTLGLLKAMLRPIVDRLRHPMLTGKFLFGWKKTPADCSLFAVLIQFFETPLNMPELREYFQPADSLKMEEEVRVLKDFVARMKASLALSEPTWARLSRKPWPLNYEQKTFDSDHWMEKYDGPFSIETDALLFGSDGLMPKEVAAVFSKIIALFGVAEQPNNLWQKELVKNGRVGDAKKAKECLLNIMAAYLCNLGKGKGPEEQRKCANEHMEYAMGYFDVIDSKKAMKKVRQIAYSTIVAYNDLENAKLVLGAIGRGKQANKVGDWKSLGSKEF